MLDVWPGSCDQVLDMSLPLIAISMISFLEKSFNFVITIDIKNVCWFFLFLDFIL